MLISGKGLKIKKKKKTYKVNSKWIKNLNVRAKLGGKKERFHDIGLAISSKR